MANSTPHWTPPNSKHNHAFVIIPELTFVGKKDEFLKSLSKIEMRKVPRKSRQDIKKTSGKNLQPGPTRIPL